MILPIYVYGQPVLRKVAEDIAPDYPNLKELIENMFETMDHAEGVGLAAPQITYIMHALKEKGLDVDVTATTVDEAKENILAVLRKCNPGKLSGDRQSVSDSQSKKENAKAETLISEMEADLTEDGTKESHSDAPDEDLSIQKETMDKKSAEQEENEGGQEV